MEEQKEITETDEQLSDGPTVSFDQSIKPTKKKRLHKNPSSLKSGSSTTSHHKHPIYHIDGKVHPSKPKQKKEKPPEAPPEPEERPRLYSDTNEKSDREIFTERLNRRIARKKEKLLKKAKHHKDGGDDDMPLERKHSALANVNSSVAALVRYHDDGMPYVDINYMVYKPTYRYLIHYLIMIKIMAAGKKVSLSCFIGALKWLFNLLWLLQSVQEKAPVFTCLVYFRLFVHLG